MQTIKRGNGEHILARREPALLKFAPLAFGVVVAAGLVASSCFGLRNRQPLDPRRAA
jgi:hypothetical protein